MRILYVALDQRVPGTTGGAVHVAAVAQGLAALGHEVDVLTGAGAGPFPAGARWHPLEPVFGLRYLRMLRAPAVQALAVRLRAEIIIERYYNFGGEGMQAARATGALGVLEVNAPVVDYPGSAKGWLDRALLVQPMRRWRDWQCRAAGLIVTPTAAIVPDFVPRDRIIELEWGADTDRFHPDVTGPLPFTRPADGVLAVFAGAFRTWHGAIDLVRAVRSLRERRRTDLEAVLIGEGPELARARAEAAGLPGVVFTGAVPHAQMPACLAAADIGVAPFDVRAHPPLQLAFYWSPLKIFEDMAAGLPVVAPAIDRLSAIVHSGEQGLLYDANAPGALAACLERLLDDAALRARLGASARRRVVSEFSWTAHCQHLDRAFRRAVVAQGESCGS